MTKNNRRYAAYPKQRDLAQVFVRWALDHLTEDGVCGYNISDTWLTKCTDGAGFTRGLLTNKINEILTSTQLTKYSMGIGGNLPTCIITFSSFYTGNIIKIESEPVSTTEFRYNRLSAHLKWTKCASQGNSQKNSLMNTFIFNEVDDSNNFSLLAKRKLGSGTLGPFKLIQADDVEAWGATHLDAEIKRSQVSKKIGLWLLGYLNTRIGKSYIRQTCRQLHTTTIKNDATAWVTNLDSCRFITTPCPDFDHYKQDRPTKFKAYMAWVEANMRDKDAFLAGIDEQFEALIG